MNRLWHGTLKPVLLLTIVVSLAHVVMVHSTHASDVRSEPAAAPHHQQHASPAEGHDPGVIGVTHDQHESETCPPPAWVTHRADVLDEAGTPSSAAPDLSPQTAAVPVSPPPAGDPPRLDGPDRQALTQVFRL